MRSSRRGNAPNRSKILRPHVPPPTLTPKDCRPANANHTGSGKYQANGISANYNGRSFGEATRLPAFRIRSVNHGINRKYQYRIAECTA